MDYGMIFLIALSLAMDAFAVSISNGVSVRGFGKKDAVRQGLYFGIFQFLMPLIGWFLGSRVKDCIAALDHWIAFLLLAVIGANMIRESLKEENAQEESHLTSKVLMLQAIATSIDALAVGISFALLDVNILTAGLIIGIIAFALVTFTGCILGKGLGSFLQAKAAFAGGTVLILIGLKILIEHLFFMG